MSAQEYNRIRRILFSVAHDPTKGFKTAYEYLQGYSSRLGWSGYQGLAAELAFYERHRKDFGLTVAGDMGEHADFVGLHNSQLTRFDVTTNIAFKDFNTYEPFMGNGAPAYKIALLDQSNFEIIDVFDLAFPRCSCGGHLIPAVVLLNQNYDRHGMSRWTNDQLLIDVCGSCESYFERDRATHHALFSPNELYDSFSTEDDEQAAAAVQHHLLDSYRYFRRSYSDYLMAVGSHQYMMTSPRGDGYWAVHFDFVNSAVAPVMPDHIECSHEL